MRYFGTDGIRGIYPEFINEDLAFRLGRAAGQYFGGSCLVGRDSRLSGGALADAFTRGLRCSGVSAVEAGIIPTPAVSFLVRKNGYAFGAAVTASHNGGEYNGIKLFGAGGVKLTQTQECSIEQLINSSFVNARLRGKNQRIDARGQYIEFLIGRGADLGGMDVYLDCAFGAAGTIAYDVFSALKANVRSYNDTYEGEKINLNCGALYPEFIKEYAREGLGFSFDGDGDRVACVENGRIIDGDSVLYTFSRTHELKGGAVVGTLMSNCALEERLKAEGRRLERTDVGDKNIAALMIKNGYNLGGEQSGHYIFYPECVSGDGILAAVKFADCFKRGLSARLELVPQITVSVPLETEGLDALIKEFEPQLKRLIVRKSGTEPRLRIMAEGGAAAVGELRTLLIKRGGTL